MELRTENSLFYQDVSSEELLDAFANDCNRGSFVILSKADQEYIQASGEGEGPYVIEYREGDEVSHFHGGEDLTKAQIQAAFLKYLHGDVSWKSDLNWVPLSMGSDKPWWKFW
ncbi:hypothetical protein P0Y35_12135 [Kiritimatiellaeota bacterium B1221]|nr:hypothetical protein [Kiritimatiellaeota bacterium B1221]